MTTPADLPGLRNLYAAAARDPSTKNCEALMLASVDALPWLLDEIARLTAENAALREGLAPFADAAPKYHKCREDRRLTHTWEQDKETLTVADLRRAARLTEPKETENG